MTNTAHSGCIQKETKERESSFASSSQIQFSLFFAAYLSATWLPYKLFQVLLMELFLIWITCSWFHFIFSLPGLQQGGFPIRRAWSLRSKPEQVMLRLVCPNSTINIWSAGFSSLQTTKATKSSEKETATQSTINAKEKCSRSQITIHGFSFSLMVYLKKYILIKQTGIYFNLPSQPCRMKEKTGLEKMLHRQWGSRCRSISFS